MNLDKITEKIFWQVLKAKRKGGHQIGKKIIDDAAEVAAIRGIDVFNALQHQKHARNQKPLPVKPVVTANKQGILVKVACNQNLVHVSGFPDQAIRRFNLEDGMQLINEGYNFELKFDHEKDAMPMLIIRPWKDRTW